MIDMPLNSIPPTTTVENYDVKKQAAREQIWVDVGFYGGVIPGNKVSFRRTYSAQGELISLCTPRMK